MLGCNGPHLYRKMAPINILQESSMVHDMARNIPIINTALENRQVDHQSTMLEEEGKISNTAITILIDS